MVNLFDFIVHIDKYLDVIIQDYETFSYVILFLIIFAETGLVVTPFLPGDSLLFIVGTFAALGSFNVLLLFLVLSLAAIMGDSLNYWVGTYIGKRIYSGNRLIKREYIEKTQDFYRRHGRKTIVIARFVPIIRTFAPFVAGIGKMDYKRFFSFNVIGGILWTGIFIFAGYYLGRIEFVQNNLSLLIIIIIFVSVLPAIVEFIRNKIRKNQGVD